MASNMGAIKHALSLLRSRRRANNKGGGALGFLGPANTAVLRMPFGELRVAVDGLSTNKENE